MPKYKKKRRSWLSAPRKKNGKSKIMGSKSQDIEMTPKKDVRVSNQTDNIRVIRGRKDRNKRRFKSITVTVCALLIVVLLFEMLLPAGIVQTVSNITALFGTGTYPIQVEEGKTLDVVSVNNYYFHLTDTHISAYSSAGKKLFSNAHGFEKPLLAVSTGKAIVYNQGGKQINVYDLKKLKTTIDTESEIISATISDSGSIAVATYSDKYASAVTVYNKHYKAVFEWYSAEDIINGVALTPGGKKLAVSTFNSSSGVFNSKVNIINFKSATPENTKTYENTLLYGLKAGNNKGFFVIKSKGIDFIQWSNYNVNEYSNEYRLALFRDCGAKLAAVFSRENDKTDNIIVVFSKSGNSKQVVDFNGLITDLRIKGSNIYCLGDTEVYVIDFNGEVKFTENYGFGGNGLVVTSANTAVIVKDNEISKIKFTEKE